MPYKYPEREKAWYQENKKRIKEKQRERYHSDEEYRKRLRKYQKEYYHAHRDRYLARCRRFFQKRKRELYKILGSDRCIICGAKKNIQFHEIHGIPHKGGVTALNLIKEHPEDFRVLCLYPCHKAVHWNMKYLGMKWDEIVIRLPLKGNDNAG